MSNANSPSWKCSAFRIALVAVTAFSLPLFAQDMSRVNVGKTQIKGVADDWTHHRVVFSNPGTEEQAIKNGSRDKWQKIVNDPRYVMQQMRRGLPVQGPAAYDANALQAFRMANREIELVRPGKFPRKPAPILIRKPKAKSSIKQDWNESLGTTSAPTPLAFPAKWSTFNTSTASCSSDFVIYPTGQPGGGSQASIIAYYNLYAGGCSPTVPAVDWAYNTGGTVSLAPVLSQNGNQVAFIQQPSSGGPQLVLLTFPLPGGGTLGSPTTLTPVSAGSYYSGGSGCAAPCMFTATLSGATGDTWSSPYYDYTSDTLFVGDSSGQLHKFNPVFNGAPAEVTTSPWPVQMAYGATPTADQNQLTSPVYDPNSGYVLVGSTTSVSATTGGRLYSVNASTGAINGYSAQLDVGYGIRDAVLMDPVASQAYVFVELNSSGNNVVDQFPLDFTSSTTPASVIVSSPFGTGTTSYQFSGTFDNTYYTSSSGTSPTGNIYMCDTANNATLYQIPITNGVLSTTATAGPQLGNTTVDGPFYGRCSPVTEFVNSSTGTAAAGSITFTSDPAGWTLPVTVTVEGTTYTFVNGPPASADEVELYTVGPASEDEQYTAENLEAVINDNSGECYTTGCVYSTQIANPSVTASYTTGTDATALTATTAGAAGNFTLDSSDSSDVAVSGGISGTDYVFLSVFVGYPGACIDTDAYGCVLSYDVTTPSTFSTGLAPGGELNVSTPYLAAPTSGIVIDNAATNLLGGGTSQMYFVTQTATGTAPCSGVCAVQASQSAP